MPIYTYRAIDAAEACAYCRTNFEIVQQMRDERLTVCPECGQSVQRIIVGANIVQGHHYGDGLSRERLKRGGLRKLVRDDSGKYVDDTPK